MADQDSNKTKYESYFSNPENIVINNRKINLSTIEDKINLRGKTKKYKIQKILQRKYILNKRK